MNEENQIEEGDDFAKMLEESEKTQSANGGIVNAIIVKISDDTVYLDTNQKMEKRMNISEITGADGQMLFKVNDSIDIIINKGIPSHKQVISKQKVNEFIKQLSDDESDKTIRVKVTGKNKGGYIVSYQDMSFFMPRSLSMLKSVDDQTGREIDVVIIKHEANEGILVSRKHFLEISSKEFEEKAQGILDKDEIVKCSIKKIINFGIFVDIDGISGVIKYSDLSHKGNVNPGELYKIDDIIEAKAIGIDAKRRVLNLSAKVLLNDPWKDIDNIVKVGEKVTGIVANIQSYGAFVNLENKDLDALLHISEISWDRNLKTPADKIAVGDKLELIITELNKEKKQLKCSLKQLSEKPFARFIQKYEVGNKVEGKIVHMTDFGAFLHIDFMDCLLLNMNCSWSRGDTCKSLFKIGESLEVVIESIDKENEKVSLSKKLLSQSPMQTFATDHNVGDKLKGTIVNIKDFGVFVKINDSIDVFIPTKDIAPLKPNEISVGQEIEPILADIDVKNSRVRATMGEVHKEEEGKDFEGNMKSFGDDSRTTLADVMRTRKK